MKKLGFEIEKEYKFTKTISESDVYLFAGIVGDFFPAHINEEYCKKMPYKKRIVHGCLTFGLCSTVSGIVGVDSGNNILAIGYDKLRFIKPVFLGDTITAIYKIIDVDEDRMKTTGRCVIKNQHNEEVLSCLHYMKIISFRDE